jgi:hypothetical protein
MIESIVLLFMLFLIVLFSYFNYKELKVYEGYESEMYLVRNLDDKDKAAQMLSKIREDLIRFVKRLIGEIDKGKLTNENDIKYYKNLLMIRDRLPNAIIKESEPGSNYTSYTINKGEELVICLRSKKDNELHGLNEIMYVAVHEIAHIGCPEIGHTPLFFKINKFLLQNAIRHNIYEYIDYGIHNMEYCGLILTSSIL